MAPPKKPVWNKFTEMMVNGAKKGKCSGCGLVMVNNAERMDKDLKKCPGKKYEDADISQVDEPGPSKVMKQTTLSKNATARAGSSACSLFYCHQHSIQRRNQ